MHIMFTENITMKKIIYSFLSIFLCLIFNLLSGCVDQDQLPNLRFWVYLVQKPNTNIIDEGQASYGIVVGDSGAVATSDGRPPVPWIERVSGTTQGLNFVKIYNHPDSTIAFAVGNNATVLRSVDKGHTWVNRNIPSESSNLYGLDFLPGFAPNSPAGEVNVVVCGNSGKVWKSAYTVSGWSWINLSISTTKKFNSVAAVNSQLFAVVGDSGIIYRTLNGGTNWENRSIILTVSLKKDRHPQL